jgi:type IV secretory pathway VirD2 relaxase
MTDRDDLPIFRPRMGKRARPSDGPHASFRNAVLARLRGARQGAESRPGGRSRIVGRPGPDARRVAIKTYVVRMNAYGAKAASLHLGYIQRDGVEADGAPGVLYGPEGPLRSEPFDEPRDGERHQFRIIISPDDGHELELTDYVRRVMARVERDVGRKLEWGAVNHYNTEHPHAHVVVRGVDLRGHEVRFDRAYISNGMRWRAQEIATEELGPRTEQDIRRTYEKEVTQERFTSLDRELERRATDQRVQLEARQRCGPVDDATLVARLAHLEEMRLADRVRPNEWVLAPGWQKTLRELGERRDIIKQMHAAVSGDPARYHVVRAGQALSTDPTSAQRVVTGRVASKGLADELKGAFYAVVETPTGRAYHVPLDARSAEGLRTGDIVSLATKPEPPVRPVDRHIAGVAAGRHGVYAVEQDPSPDAARAARRMRDLERLGLAATAGTNRWTVVPNLLEELERQHRDAPARHRLLLHKQPLSIEAQVRHPGPVWLDRIDPASLAPSGLGAEVRRALEQRRDALRHIGITDNDPDRFAKLRELERRSVSKEVVASSRQVFLASTPDGFRGRVLGIHASRTGTSYTAVSDGQRFVLIKTSPSLRGLQDKAVTLSRDAKGRLVAREVPDRGLER